MSNRHRLDVSQKPGSTKTLISGSDGAVVRRTVLPGGLRVITEAMPSVRSVSFGVWVGVGSRDETVAQAGSSHYLEHVLFKGTKRRDALEISAALDAVGGEMNAFTAKEYTCYYARVLDRDLPLAIDVICDMVTSSLIAKADVDGEQEVGGRVRAFGLDALFEPRACRDHVDLDFGVLGEGVEQRLEQLLLARAVNVDLVGLRERQARAQRERADQQGAAEHGFFLLAIQKRGTPDAASGVSPRPPSPAKQPKFP